MTIDETAQMRIIELEKENKGSLRKQAESKLYCLDP